MTWYTDIPEPEELTLERLREVNERSRIEESVKPLNDADKYHGVYAPAWKDDDLLVSILRTEAKTGSVWDSDRNRALMLHAADRLEDMKHNRDFWIKEAMAYQAGRNHVWGIMRQVHELTSHV